MSTRALLIAACALLTTGAAPAHGLRALAFKSVAASPADARQICALAGKACTAADQVELFQAAEGDWWAILPGRPTLLRLAKTNKGWSIDRTWDFSAHKSFVPDSTRSLHPALYPVAPGVWAAALVETRSEGYSGGGGAFASAMFIPLDGTSASPLPGPVPFSCSRMVRACFTERDYETSRHCHDEWEGWLTLSYKARGQGPYAWTGAWHETVWPSGASEAAKVTRTTTPDKANFCEWQDSVPVPPSLTR